MTKWQPIETAPKDGTGVIVFYYAKAGMAFAFWADGKWLEVSPALPSMMENEYCTPTHWMPLPESPEELD